MAELGPSRWEGGHCSASGKEVWLHSPSETWVTPWEQHSPRGPGERPEARGFPGGRWEEQMEFLGLWGSSTFPIGGAAVGEEG